MTSDVVGGVWDYSCALAGELRRAGHEVTLLAFGLPTVEHRRRAAAAGTAVRSAPLKLEWMRGSDEDVRLSRLLVRELVAELHPTVIQAGQYCLGDLDLGIPVVVTAHSDVLSWLRFNGRPTAHQSVPSEWQPYATLVRRGLEGAAAVVAVSHFMAAQLRELYAPSLPIHVIHNGWSGPPEGEGGDGALPGPQNEDHLRRRKGFTTLGSENSPPTKRNPSFTALGSNPRPPVTLMGGRVWDGAKNVVLAAQAAQRMANPGRVLLAGDQRHPETGVRVQMPAPIECLGWLSHEALGGQLERARVFLAPARYEPFGLLPLQAALHGCALLLADIPSFRELWEDCALFFHPDDPVGLHAAWERLLEDDVLASDLAARAGRRARDAYSAERMAAEYLSLYARLPHGVSA